MMEADPLIPEEEVAGLAMGIEETGIMVTMITKTMEITRTRFLEMVTTGIMEILIGIKYSVKSATSLTMMQLIAITGLIQIM